MKTFALVFGLIAMGCTYQVQEPGDDMVAKYRGGETPIEQVKGWSNSGKLTTDDPNGSVRLQANFNAPESYTVSFSVNRGIDPTTGGPLVIQTANAIIKWAVEGNFITREVTVTDGMSVTGVGQGVDVKVFDATPVQLGNSGQSYTVAITVAPGERAGTAIPPTFPLVDPATGKNSIDIVGAGSKTFNVPQGVGIISVEVTAATLSGNAIPNQGAQVGQQSGALSVKSYDPRDVDGFTPVLPGINHIQVINNMAGETMRFTITWGIDG